MLACSQDFQKTEDCHGWAVQGPQKACLEQNMDSLSSKCREHLFRKQQEAAENIRLNIDVVKSCRREIATHCKDEEYGEARILKCLWSSSLMSATGEDFGHTCREKVMNLTVHSVQDYRLDFRVRTRCAADITAYCAEEKNRVDKLSITELFGGNGKAGEAGQVLRCLKVHYLNLTNDMCRQEMRRVVGIASYHPDADPVFARACHADKLKHCNGTRPGRLHLCLRQHVIHLTPACRNATILQGRLELHDIAMKPNVLLHCRPAIKKYCNHPGWLAAQTLECLQDHGGEDDIPFPCKQEVNAELEASNNDWRLKYGISSRCEGDIMRLCAPETKTGGGLVLECLKSKILEVKKNSCRTELARFVGQQGSWKGSAAQLVCMEDATTFCKDVTPGEGRMHNCLLAHKSELHPACAQKEFTHWALQALDIRTSPMAMMRCAAVMRQLCPGVNSAGMWKCLEDHEEHQDMPVDCKRLIKQHSRLAHSEFHLNSGLGNACTADARTLCPAQLARADAKNFSSNGSVLECLIGHRHEVKNDDCHQRLNREIQQRMSHFTYDPQGRAKCDADVKKFCGPLNAVFNGHKIHKCLSDHLAELSEECRKHQHSKMALASEDFNFNNGLMRACLHTKGKLCADVPRGQSRIITCLLDHMDAAEMDEGCKEKLLEEQGKRAKHYSFNPQLQVDCSQDLQALVKNSSCSDKKPEGWQMDCLAKHAKTIRARACFAAVQKLLTRYSADFRAVPRMSGFCRNDTRKFCGNTSFGKGQMQACLRKHESQLAPRCKSMVQSLSKMTAHNSWSLRGKCSNEARAFCPNVPLGTQELSVCLAVHRSQEGFTSDCRDALDDIPQARGPASSLPELAMLEDLKKWLRSHRSFMDRWGGMLLGGSLGFVALLTFVISYCVIQRRFGKVGYTVIVPRDLDS